VGGKITLFSGPMGGNKTKELVTRHRGNLSQSRAILPDVDTRSGGALITHPDNGGVRQVENRNVLIIQAGDPGMILEELGQALADGEVKQIIVDETNFWSPALVAVLEEVAGMDVEVYAGGLLLDSNLEDFGATRKVGGIAGEVVQMFADCDGDEGQCDERATYNYFKGVQPGQVFVGGFQNFGAACPDHYNDFREEYGLEPLPDEIVCSNRWEIIVDE